jgi:hypothetical protein
MTCQAERSRPQTAWSCPSPQAQSAPMMSRLRPTTPADAGRSYSGCRLHEIEQIIEPAARISCRSTVKLGLHIRYPPAWFPLVQPRSRRRRSATHLSALQSRSPSNRRPPSQRQTRHRTGAGSSPPRAPRQRRSAGQNPTRPLVASRHVGRPTSRPRMSCSPRGCP